MIEKKFHRESVEGVEAVLERMWVAVGKPMIGYAQSFDVSENDIKNWRRRGRVARAYLEGFASCHGVSLDWLLHGEQDKPHQVSENLLPSGLSADEAALLETYREIDPEARVTLQNLLRVIAGGAAAAVAPKAAPRQSKTAVVLETEYKGKRTGPQVYSTEYTGKRTGPTVIGQDAKAAPKKKRKDEAS